jgi:integrase
VFIDIRGRCVRPRPLEKTRYPGIYKRGSRYVLIYRDDRGRQRQQSAATLAEAKAKRSSVLSDVGLALAPVRAMFATAYEDEIIRANPAARLRLALPQLVQDDEAARREKALSEQELARVNRRDAGGVAAVRDAFLAQTGLRPSEALALKWGDLDLRRRRVQVRRSVNRGRVGPPKTKHGRRDVPLTEGMARSLWNERKARKATDGEPVFVRYGVPVDREAGYRAVRAAAKRAGVPWAGLRTLRHTCASILFRRGFNPKQVQAWLGHYSAAFTLATYVHLLPDDLPEPTFFDAITGAAGVSSVSARPAENGRDREAVAQ